MRYLLLSALVGGWVLLAPYDAPSSTPNVSGLPGLSPVSYVQGPLDNPAEPGDAFPTGPFAGGTG